MMILYILWTIGSICAILNFTKKEQRKWYMPQHKWGNVPRKAPPKPIKPNNY